LAANIFDWGAKACVELYTNGTILDIYREVGANPRGRGGGREGRLELGCGAAQTISTCNQTGPDRISTLYPA
jgi:hypothetical protein